MLASVNCFNSSKKKKCELLYIHILFPYIFIFILKLEYYDIFTKKPGKMILIENCFIQVQIFTNTYIFSIIFFIYFGNMRIMIILVNNWQIDFYKVMLKMLEYDFEGNEVLRI